MNIIERIYEYIEKLNNGYEPKYIDKKEQFSNGDPINQFWNLHKDKVMEVLNTESRYLLGYEKAKGMVIKKYQESEERKNSLTYEEKVNEFIEMLNKGYQPKPADKNNHFSDGNLINQFWAKNQNKIMDILYNEQKYEIGYEVAKETVRKKQQKNSLSYEEKIYEFIEKLNNGYEPKKEDKIERFSNGHTINSFWYNNQNKIMEVLTIDLKYSLGYERAKEIANRKYKENEERRNFLTYEEKMNEFIEKLNNGYQPKTEEKKEQFSDGNTINKFWYDNKDKIIEILNTDSRYAMGYEVAKETVRKKQQEISLSFEEKIVEYIEKLNSGYEPKWKDEKEAFSNGDSINQFWNSHKDKIIEMLNNDPQYAMGYEEAKKIIKITICVNALKEKRKLRKKDEYNLSNILKEFDVDIETLNRYLCRVNKIEYIPKTATLMKDDETLRSYCIKNGYNYDVIARAIRLHQFCPNDTLEQLINRSITSYTFKGQNNPSIWIYEKYNILIKHILLYLGLDSYAILKNMTNYIISLEEAIRHDVFRLNVKEQEHKWLEELYNYIINEIDLNKDKSTTEHDIAEMIYILSQEYNLEENELNILWNVFEKYVNTIKLYEKVDVGLETNYEKKITKIKEYNLDEYDIEESFFIPLEFDHKVLIGKQSELYKRRQLIRQYIIDWDYYTQEEKIKIINSNSFTNEEVEMINKIRSQINQIIEHTKKK